MPMDDVIEREFINDVSILALQLQFLSFLVLGRFFSVEHSVVIIVAKNEIVRVLVHAVVKNASHVDDNLHRFHARHSFKFSSEHHMPSVEEPVFINVIRCRCNCAYVYPTVSA